MPPADFRAPTDMKSLASALNQAPEGIGEVKRILCSATFCPRLPGLTKMISNLSKAGAFRKGLEVFYALPELGIVYDTTITNAAISACDKGNQWQTALEIFWSMPELGLHADAITYSSVISALAKGKQWAAALQVFENMQAHKVEADVVTCCSLISALERGGQWQLAEQLFNQMCEGSFGGAANQPLRHLAAALEMQPPLVDASSSPSPGGSESRNQLLSTDSNLSELMTKSVVGSQACESPLSHGQANAKGWKGGSLTGLDLTPTQMIPGARSVARNSRAIARTSSSPSPLLSMSSIGSKSISGSNSFESVPDVSEACKPASGQIARLSLDPPRKLVSSVSADCKSLRDAFAGAADGLTPPSSLDSSESAATRIALEGCSANSAQANGSQFPVAWQLGEGCKLPPVTPRVDAKAGALKKCGTGLVSILESRANSPLSPAPPTTPFQALGSSRRTSEVGTPMRQGSINASPTANQGSAGVTIYQNGLSILQNQQLGSSLGVTESSQLAIDGCPLPVSLERQPGLDGRIDVASPIVPRLKFMGVSRIAPNRVCCNALLAAFARARPSQWQKALTLLEAMTAISGEVSPDVVSYNTCLKACGSASKLQHAIQVYKMMVGEGVMPSITTYGTLLTAASHAGSVGTVKQIWQWLSESSLEVSSACVHAYVSALAKRGCWDEASMVLCRHTERQGGQMDPTLRQAASLLPAASANAIVQQASARAQGPIRGEAQLHNRLHQISQAALVAGPQDLPLLASEALAAFQQLSSQGAVPGHAFASLLCILGCGGLWETAIDIYHNVPIKDSLEPGVVSNLVSTYATSGQLFWALHYWLAQNQRGGPLPSISAHHALLCACRAQGAWQPAVHILQTMLPSTVHPDRLCFGAVLQVLVRSGLLALAAQILLLMPQGGLWPDAGLMSDVLSCIDPPSVTTQAGLESLLQVMAGCGLSTARALATVAKNLNPAVLPHISLHLLNCLPPNAEQAAEAHRMFIGRLVSINEIAAAVQVMYRGHAVGALKHYRPFFNAQTNDNKGSEAGGEPLVELDLSACTGQDSAAIVLLAWACSFSQALHNDAKIQAKDIVIVIGSENAEGSPQRLGGVISAVKGILAADASMKKSGVLAALNLPGSAALQAVLAAPPQHGKFGLPTPAVTAWVTSIQKLAEVLLAPR